MAKKKRKRNVILQGIKVVIGIAVVGSIAAVGEAIWHLKSVQWDTKQEGE